MRPTVMTASHESERHAFFTGVDLATYELSFLWLGSRTSAGTGTAGPASMQGQQPRLVVTRRSSLSCGASWPAQRARRRPARLRAAASAASRSACSRSAIAIASSTERGAFGSTVVGSTTLASVWR